MEQPRHGKLRATIVNQCILFSNLIRSKSFIRPISKEQFNVAFIEILSFTHHLGSVSWERCIWYPAHPSHNMSHSSPSGYPTETWSRCPTMRRRLPQSGPATYLQKWETSVKCNLIDTSYLIWHTFIDHHNKIFVNIALLRKCFLVPDSSK